MLLKIKKKIEKLSAISRAKVMGNGVHVYWWDGKKNFGDLITPELFSKYGCSPIHSDTQHADVIGIGSLLHMLPEDYAGTIMGTGMIKDEKISLPNANFVAVRGEYSRANLGLPTTVALGDFGLLSPKLVSNQKTKKYSVGLIPHFVDKAHPWIAEMKMQLGNNATIIEVQDSATSVAKQIAECEMVISSSLHGLIVADSFGIPNVWMELSNQVIGDGFKFKDYNSAIDYEQAKLAVTATTTMSDVEAHLSDKNMKKIDDKKNELDLILQSVLSDNKR